MADGHHHRYQVSGLDRVRASKLALFQLSSSVALVVAVATASIVVTLLTYVGLQAYNRCLDAQHLSLDATLHSYNLCKPCEPMPLQGGFMCSECSPAQTYSELRSQSERVASLQTTQEVHNALGWLWDWCGVTWPTRLLTAWVLLINQYASAWAYVSMVSWIVTLVWMAVRTLGVRSVQQARSALAHADQQLPASYKPRPTVAQLLSDQPIDIDTSDMMLYRADTMDGLRQRMTRV